MERKAQSTLDLVDHLIQRRINAIQDIPQIQEILNECEATGNTEIASKIQQGQQKKRQKLL